MTNENERLLNNVIKDRLEKAISDCESDDEKSKALQEAVLAIEKQVEIDRLDNARIEQQEKQKIEYAKINIDSDVSAKRIKTDEKLGMTKLHMEKEQNILENTLKRDEGKKDRIVQVVIFGTGLVLGKVIDFAIDRSHTKFICNFERTDSFGSMAGRSLLSRLFKQKK